MHFELQKTHNHHNKVQAKANYDDNRRTANKNNRLFYMVFWKHFAEPAVNI